MLTTRITGPAFDDCVAHLDALDGLRFRPVAAHRGDIISRLSLVLSQLARAVAADTSMAGAPAGRTHAAVVDAMPMMESRPAHAWTLSELAEDLHLTPGYLVRLFKSATGLPHTDHPVSHIAQAVGWPDQNYFARRFRSHYGLSATPYRSRFTHRSVRMGHWPDFAPAKP